MEMGSKMYPLRLDNKIILITGGRTGLGFAMAKCVAEAGGFPIIVGSAPQEAVEEAAKLLPSGCGYRFDITDTKHAQRFVDELLKKYGHIDGLINNAGVHCKKPFDETTLEDFDRVFDVHIKGAVALTQAVLPSMRERGSGSVIFISSMSAMIGLTKVCAYSAAKSAVLGLVKDLSGEYAGEGIRFNAIAPGFIDTPMFHKAVDDDIPRQQKILGHTPMNAYGQPEDIGWAAVYLCSDASRFVTGVNLPVDGGCCIGF